MFLFNYCVVVRVDALDHKIVVDQLNVVPKPYTGGGDNVVRLIDGSRKSIFVQSRWDVDIEMKWTAFSDESDRQRVATLLAACAAGATTSTFMFCPGDSYVSAAAIEVIPQLEESALNYNLAGGVREKSALLKFVTRELLTNLPTWILQDSLT